MYKAIIFDFDGVIIDSEYYHFQAFQKILSSQSITIDYDSYTANGYIGLPDRTSVIKALTENNIPFNDAIIEKLLSEKEKIFNTIITHGKLEAIPGIVAIIEAAYQAKIPMAISSGSFRADIDVILNNLLDGKLRQYFPIIACASDVKNSKPAPDSYLLAAKQLGVEPTQCIAIEDSPHGVAAAKAAGLKVYAVTTTTDINKLTQADEIIDDLTPLTLASLLAS